MSDTAAPAALKRTPLHDVHVALGAKIVPFAGYEMPVQYPAGITAEHRTVRESCGMFDVSHMGEFWITGPRAVEFVNFVTTNDVGALAVGQVQYSTILNDRGTIEDDCLVYRFADRIMMVVNASNAEKDFAHIARHADAFGVKLHDASDDMALIAVQGPKAAPILQKLVDVNLADIEYYHFTEGEVAERRAHLERNHGNRRSDAGRTRLPGFAASRDGNGALRQRHRRHRHAARGKSRVDREVAEG